jgi:hypothetical protein
MRSILKGIFLIAVLLLVLLYIYDGLSARHRMSAQKQGDPFDAHGASAHPCDFS